MGPSSFVIARHEEYGMDVGEVRGGEVMKAAFVVKFTTSVPGREKAALAYAREVDDFWGKKAAEGLCTEPKWFWATAGESMWFVEGVRSAPWRPCYAEGSEVPGHDNSVYDEVQTILTAVGGRLGIPLGDAELLRLHSNATFALPSAGLLVRIATNPAAYQRIATAIAITRWLRPPRLPVHCSRRHRRPADHRTREGRILLALRAARTRAVTNWSRSWPAAP
jgi:hypothetical protein